MLTILSWDNVPVVLMSVCSNSVAEVEIKFRAKATKVLTTPLNITKLLWCHKTLGTAVDFNLLATKNRNIPMF